MTDRFTQGAEHALNRSQSIAGEYGHTYIGTEHLLIALASEAGCTAAKILEERGVTEKQIRCAVRTYSGSGVETSPNPADMTPRMRLILESARQNANQTPAIRIGTEHLLCAILEEKECVAYHILLSLGAHVHEIKNDLLNCMLQGKKISEKSRQIPLTDFPALSSYGRDLTAMAAGGKLDPVLCREKETDRLIRILSRRTKNNPCLIGEPGVGKTAVVEGLAQRIVAEDVPEMLLGKSIIALDLAGMIAGAKYRGEFEERIKNVMQEINRAPSIILFIDEIHTIVGAGAAEGAVDAANILKPALARGEMQLIGATTQEEYRKHIEKDAALERRFQPVNVEEPEPEDAVRILSGLRGRFEVHHGVRITDDAIRSAVYLSKRYIHDRFLPDKAIDLLDEACAAVRLRKDSGQDRIREMEDALRSVRSDKEKAVIAQDFGGAHALREKEIRLLEQIQEEKAKAASASHPPKVESKDIAQIVWEWTGIPTVDTQGSPEEQPDALADRLRRRVIGQDEAIDAVTRAIGRNRFGIGDPSKPIGCFLFVGPTGVGKTELCRALACALYGSEDAMIRLNMSEYQAGISASKLIGSPPGYVGYDEGGQLTEQVRRRPYSLILFDEIEKAHPDVYHLLLQVMDDGRLRDSRGRLVDFRNTVIILTSNLGFQTKAAMAGIGFGDADDSEREIQELRDMQATLKRHFEAEFLNRLDEIIPFHRLSRDNIRRITKLQVDQLVKNLAASGITLTVDDAVSENISEKGYDPEFGVRPIKRLIAKKIGDPVTAGLSNGTFQRGDALHAVWENGETVIEKQAVHV